MKMKKLMLFSFTIAVAVMITGCASIQTAGEKSLNGQKLVTSGTNVAHINGSNWGLYLLSIPLLTGSTEKPGNMVFGQDTVNVKSVVKMVTNKSKELGAQTTADMVSSASSIWIMPTFVLFIRQVQVSGNGVR